MKKLTLVLSIISTHVFAVGHIHIFGDSHAYHCFSDQGLTNYFFQYKDQTFPISIPGGLGAQTMYKFGDQKTGAINIKHYGVGEGDIALFTLGEIDVRMHIGKQRDQRTLNLAEILSLLVHNYIEAIQENRAQFKKLHCVVMEVAPPTNQHFNPNFPYYGSLEDRIAITRQLNQGLRHTCALNNIHFLQLHDLYANKDGSLNIALSDGLIHVGMHHSQPIKERLAQLVLDILNNG
jgi:hypothetical protein